MAFAEAVRFSMLEDATDSLRSRMAANGATSSPNSASKRAMLADACEARFSVSGGQFASCHLKEPPPAR